MQELLTIKMLISFSFKNISLHALIIIEMKATEKGN